MVCHSEKAEEVFIAFYIERETARNTFGILNIFWINKLIYGCLVVILKKKMTVSGVLLNT